MTIDPMNTVFAINPDLTMLQFVRYNARQLHWDTSIVTKSLLPSEDKCGPIKFEIYQLDAGSTEIPLDPAIFYSDTTATHIDVQTYDYGKTGLYSLRLKVFHDAYPSVVFDRDFLVEI